MHFHVGFTGTREGMTLSQWESLRDFMERYRVQFEEHFVDGRLIFHHGDCVGADAEAHLLALETGWDVVVHPPEDPKERAWCASSDESELANAVHEGMGYGDELAVVELPPRPYLDRNTDIVVESAMLVACPKEVEEQLRSGTWATVRAAERLGRLVVVVLPDGETVIRGTHTHDDET